MQKQSFTYLQNIFHAYSWNVNHLNTNKKLIISQKKVKKIVHTMDNIQKNPLHSHIGVEGNISMTSSIFKILLLSESDIVFTLQGM